VYEQVRRVLSASHIQAEVERFLIEITIYWMIHEALIGETTALAVLPATAADLGLRVAVVTAPVRLFVAD